MCFLFHLNQEATMENRNRTFRFSINNSVNTKLIYNVYEPETGELYQWLVDSFQSYVNLIESSLNYHFLREITLASGDESIRELFDFMYLMRNYQTTALSYTLN